MTLAGLLLTGWKTYLGMALMMLGHIGAALLPDLGIWEYVRLIGEILGGIGVTHKAVRMATKEGSEPNE